MSDEKTTQGAGNDWHYGGPVHETTSAGFASDYGAEADAIATARLHGEEPPAIIRNSTNPVPRFDELATPKESLSPLPSDFGAAGDSEVARLLAGEPQVHERAPHTAVPHQTGDANWHRGGPITSTPPAQQGPGSAYGQDRESAIQRILASGGRLSEGQGHAGAAKNEANQPRSANWDIGA